MIARVTPSRLKNLMSLPRCPTLTHSTLRAIFSMAGSVSSLIAATIISTPSLRAPSSTRKGNRPLPAINPNFILLYRIAHHRPRRRAARAFFEPRFDKGRRQARPHERVRLLILRLDRIALDDSPAALTRKINRGLEQLRRKAAAPMFLRDEEAYHRPDRLFIDWFQDSGAFKTQKLLARRDRTPSDRLAVPIGDDSGRAAAVNQFLHRALVPGALLRFILRAREAWPHTPASSACAALAEERFKIAPAFRRQRMKFDF